MIKTVKIKKIKDKYFVEGQEIELDTKAYLFLRLNGLTEYTAIVGDTNFEFSRPMILKGKNKEIGSNIFNRKINIIYVR